MATQLEKASLIRTWMTFMELPPKPPLNYDNRVCGMELDNTKRFLRLSRHFTVMTTVALLVAVVEVTSLLPHAAKIVEILPMVLSISSVCNLVFVK
jgi:hypothetical protein